MSIIPPILITLPGVMRISGAEEIAPSMVTSPVGGSQASQHRPVRHVRFGCDLSTIPIHRFSHHSWIVGDRRRAQRSTVVDITSGGVHGRSATPASERSMILQVQYPFKTAAPRLFAASTAQRCCAAGWRDCSPAFAATLAVLNEPFDGGNARLRPAARAPAARSCAM